MGLDLRAADDEGDLEAFDAEPLFAPGHGAAVIGEEDDEGVVEDAFGLELIEDGADALVDDFDAALVGVPIAADEGVVGVVCGQFDGGEGGGIEGVGDGEGAVGFGDLELGEEGLVWVAFAPVVTVEELFGVVDEVVVGFAFGDLFAAALGAGSGGVGDEPAGFAEQCGKGFVGSGERLGIFGVVRMQAGGGLVAAEDEG